MCAKTKLFNVVQTWHWWSIKLKKYIFYRKNSSVYNIFFTKYQKMCLYF